MMTIRSGGSCHWAFDRADFLLYRLRGIVSSVIILLELRFQVNYAY